MFNHEPGLEDEEDKRRRLDINHPSHRNGVREGVWLGGLGIIATLVFVIAIRPEPNLRFLFLAIGFCLSALAGLWMRARIARANHRR